MSQLSAKCQFVDRRTNMGCEEWYPFEEGRKYCDVHLNGNAEKDLEIAAKNKYLVEYQDKYHGKQGVLDLAAHIREVESQLRAVIKDLENRRWSGNKILRDLESELSDEEREETRSQTRGERGPHFQSKKSKMSKLTGKAVRPKKDAFLQKNLGMSMADFANMSDEEQEAKIAKFMAAKKAAKG